VDLDSPAALAKADDFLPYTPMADGRPSKPRSHLYYLVPNDTIPRWAESNAEQGAAAARARCGHAGPALKHFAHAETGRGILDFIGTGGMVVCPPSVHASGERRGWDGDRIGTPVVVDFHDLWDAVQRLAEECGWSPAPAPDYFPGSEANGTAGHTGTGGPSVLARAKEWLAKVPGAVSGQGGHDQTFTAAVGLVHGFALSEDDALRLLADDYNPRCMPPWSEKELRHKITDAATKPHDKPKGWLRDAPPPGDRRSETTATGPTLPAGDPADPVPIHPTDTGNALEFAADHMGDLVYVPAWG
jgi:hypothetical protein